MPDLHDDQALKEALYAASTHVLSADELREQRVSFVMASVSDSNDVSRAQVERILDENEGRKDQK